MDNDLLLQTIQGFRTDIQQLTQKVDSSIVNHAERLSAVETSHKELKEAVDKAENRQWIHSLVIVPIVAGLHALGNYLGIKV
jgi:hypothetical protein